MVQENPKLALMAGDIGNRLFDDFKAVCADQFFNCGVAEANMMGMAAGLAMSGYRPIVYTITPFVTTRCYEQIRVDVCYHNVPVIIVGTGSGFSYAQLGPTHHSLEDIAILRALPGMTVFCPCDPAEMRLGLRAALEQDGPVYIRLGKKGEPDLTSEQYSKSGFALGQATTLRKGNDLCLISTGTIMPVVLDAAEQLENQGVSVRVENFRTVKPLDTDRLEEVFTQYKTIAVIEEHSRIGGLYGAISEWCSGRVQHPEHLISLAVDDVFLHEVGSQDYARSRFGLTAENITEQVLKAHGSTG